ncbi:MAG: pyruvate kinase [Lachnospiraceae bacterium]|nr:pyruvate kinase [Lachnospiraceae bacterium]MDD3615010.1 pyruvate kinase [Lachnospiraceae bacterium]
MLEQIKKRTKIICTMGPNSEDTELVKKLCENGMDIARFNFSHGDYEEQKRRMDMIKSIRKELKLPIAILLDTKGPEIRTGVLEDGKKVTLEDGAEFTLTQEQIVGNASRVSITYDELHQDVKPGDTILIDDGLIGLEVAELKDKDIVCKVVSGGELGEKKGVNVPNIRVNLPAITEKDKADIVWGIGQDVDFIAASFVRSAAAVQEIRQLLKDNGGEHISIIAKIENNEGVENIDEIIEAADGIMVARGDLGVEIPAYEVPHIQKRVILKCNLAYKPVITATQMLDSMIRHPRPTRAEATDVANAIYDGTDAIMLSGETAMGKYPLEAVQMMVEIAEATEQYMDNGKYIEHRTMEKQKNVSSAVSLAAVRTARNIDAACIVTPTISGQTARMVSNFRPTVPIYAVSPNGWAQRKMQIYWGVTPIRGYEEDSTEDIISHAMYVVKRAKKVKPGDMVVFTAGDPATNVVSGEGAMTNILHVIQAK